MKSFNFNFASARSKSFLDVASAWHELFEGVILEKGLLGISWILTESKTPPKTNGLRIPHSVKKNTCKLFVFCPTKKLSPPKLV